MQYSLVILLAIITLIILIAGVAIMARGGKINKKWSNRLMTARVISQVLVVLLLILLFVLR